MMYEFGRREGTTHHVLVVFFRYLADEAHLLVHGVGYRALEVLDEAEGRDGQ